MPVTTMVSQESGLLREPLKSLGIELGEDGEDSSIMIEDLVGDGSDRRFYRLRQGSTSFVVLRAPGSTDGCPYGENDSYFRIGTYLRQQGIPVPRIYWADTTAGLFILEDLGGCHLQKLAHRGTCNIHKLYDRALRMLVHLHINARRAFESSFCFDTVSYDPPFIYSRELEYFRKAFLIGYLGAEIDEEDLRNDFQRLAGAAGTYPGGLVFHRDFQSRNIMVFRGSLRLIDFQGMRFGPPTYDLASLLLDPYVSLDLKLQERMVRHYWKATAELWGNTFHDFVASYRAVRLCRTLQVLGAYGFLGIVKGKTHFLAYIPRAWGQLRAWLAGPVRGQYPQLEKTVAQLHSWKAPLLQHRSFSAQRTFS